MYFPILVYKYDLFEGGKKEKETTVQGKYRKGVTSEETVVTQT